jgi:exosortase
MTASAPTAPPWRLTFDHNAQLKAGITAVIFVATFWNLLSFIPGQFGDLVSAWWHKSDWSHGPIIPLFSAYLVHTRWEQIRRTPIKYTWLGLPIILVGILAWIWALLFGLFAYAKPLSMMVTLLGVIIFLCGLPVMRHAWVPYLFLFFAIPLPQRIYFSITNPLRQAAASFVTNLLA